MVIQGNFVAGPLTAMQEKDIAECFSMLDEDGSGALDVSELVKAFKMLGFQARTPLLLLTFSSPFACHVWVSHDQSLQLAMSVFRHAKPCNFSWYLLFLTLNVKYRG